MEDSRTVIWQRLAYADTMSAEQTRMTEYGPDLGTPHTRAIGDGLFEARAKASAGIGRALYCTLVGQRIVVLHGYIKKTDKTPPKEIKIARQRLKELKP